MSIIRIGSDETIFSQGENPAVYGGRESDTC